MELDQGDAYRVPELPSAKRACFIAQYEVSADDAGVLADDLDLGAHSEKAAEGACKPKLIANWILNDLENAPTVAGLTICIARLYRGCLMSWLT